MVVTGRALCPDLHRPQQSRPDSNRFEKSFIKDTGLKQQQPETHLHEKEEHEGGKNEKCTVCSDDRQIHSAYSGVKWRLDP